MKTTFKIKKALLRTEKVDIRKWYEKIFGMKQVYLYRHTIVFKPDRGFLKEGHVFTAIGNQQFLVTHVTDLAITAKTTTLVKESKVNVNGFATIYTHVKKES